MSSTVVQLEPRAWHPGPIFLGITALMIALACAALVVGDPYLAQLFSPRLWQKLRLADSPIKTLLFVPFAVIAFSLALHHARKAGDMRTFLVVMMAVAMQTNGVKLGGIDFITVLPFVAVLFVLAECMLKPATPLHLTGVTFFALLLLLLDVPYLMDTNTYGPVRWLINWVSALKAFMVAVALIMLIDDERRMHIAVRALVVVAVISAAIGVGQIVVEKLTGRAFTLASEQGEIKPTFLGTVLRASGLTTWAQWLADFSILAVPFILFAITTAKTAKAVFKWLAALAVVLAGTFFTFTYAAYVAIGAIAVVFPFVRWPRRMLHFAIAGLLLLAIFYKVGGFDWLQSRAIPKFNATTGMVERRTYLQATLDDLTRNPWTGSGFYSEEEASENFYRKRVHNTGLQAWENLGLAGFLAFISMMLITFTQLWLVAAAREERAVKQTLQALALGMGGTMLAMFAEPNLTAPVTWYMLGLASAAVRVWRPQPRFMLQAA